MEIAFFTGSPE